MTDVAHPASSRSTEGSKITPSAAAPTRIDRRAVDRMLPWFDRHRRKFFTVILLIYLGGFNGQWRIEPDGALYLSIAHNLASGQGYTYHGEPHHLAYPGLPYLVAATFRIFGDGNLWPIHAIILLCALTVLALTYALITRAAGRPTAVMVTILLGCSFQFYGYAFQLRNDMPFVLGVMMFLLGLERLSGRSTFVAATLASPSSTVSDENGDAGVAATDAGDLVISWLLLIVGLAIAIVMRPAMWALIPAILGSVAWSALRGRAGKGLILITMLVLAAIAVFWMLDPRRSGSPHFSGDYEVETLNAVSTEIGATMTRVVRQNIPTLFGPILAETMLGIEAGPCGANEIFGVAILVLGIALVRTRVIWGLWIASTAAMMLIVLPNNAILPRYLLPVLPFLVYGWWTGLVWINKRLPRPLDWIFVILFAATLTSNLVKIGDLIREQRHRNFLTTYRNGRYPPMLEMAGEIRKRVEPNAIVLGEPKSGRVMSYYSGGRRVIEAFEATSLDPKAQPLYVVEPAGDTANELLKRHHLYVGERVAWVPDGAADSPGLSLHRVTDVAPAPSTQPDLLGNGARFPADFVAAMPAPPAIENGRHGRRPYIVQASWLTLTGDARP